tara:strand:- start:651 stop:785 length:135 start_codon:yes stop_codon:yes gene_type:complete
VKTYSKVDKRSEGENKMREERRGERMSAFCMGKTIQAEKITFEY